MEMINAITMAIITKVKDGETIRSLAMKMNIAYSAVYKWVMVLERYGVIQVIRKGNRNILKINKNEIYEKAMGLYNSIETMRKERYFWNIVKRTKIAIRFVRGTAIAIWTKGGYIPGDFADRIYMVEVEIKGREALKHILKKENIAYTEKEITRERPLIYIIPKAKINRERKEGMPVMPLKELVSWCEKLGLDNVLEHLNEIYHLKLKVRYAEVNTNRRCKE